MKRFILFFILFFFPLFVLSDSGIMRDNTKVKKAGDTMTGDLTGTNIIVPGILTINTVDASGSSVTLNTNCYISVGYDLRVSSAYVYELWVSSIRGMSPVVFPNDVIFNGNIITAVSSEIGTSTTGVKNIYIAGTGQYFPSSPTDGKLIFNTQFTTNTVSFITLFGDNVLMTNAPITVRLNDRGSTAYTEWGQDGASDYGLHLGGICASTGKGYLGLFSGQYNGIKLSNDILGIQGLYVQKGLGSGGGLTFAPVKAFSFDCVNPEGTSKSVLSYDMGDQGREGTTLTTYSNSELTIRGNYNSVNHTAAIFDTGAANIGAWYTLNLVPLRDNQDIGHQSLVAGCSTYRNIYYKGDLYPSNFKVHLSSEGTSVGDSLQIFTTSASWGAGIQPAPAPDSQCRISTGTIATGSVELVFGDSVTTAGNLIGYESIIHIPLTMKLIDFTLGSTISGEVTVEVSSCATAGGVFVVVSTGEMLSSQTDNANSNLGNWTITTMDRGWMKFKILYAATVKQITMSMGIKKL